MKMNEHVFRLSFLNMKYYMEFLQVCVLSNFIDLFIKINHSNIRNFSIGSLYTKILCDDIILDLS